MAEKDIQVGDKGVYQIGSSVFGPMTAESLITLTPCIYDHHSLCLFWLVEWKYGGGHPQGTAAEIKYHPGEKVQVESRKGNTITRNADEDNPAVRVERQGDGNNQDVVKRMTELTKVGEGKEKEGEENGTGAGEKREREAMEKEHQSEKVGEGEQADEPQDEKAVEDKEPETKRAKLDETSQVGTEEQKPRPKTTRGRGRGRGKTASTTTTGTRRGGRPKKESRKKSAGTSQVEDTNDEAGCRRSQDPHN